MEEPRITEKTSIEGIRKAVSQMQETYPNDALIIVPEGLWKDVKTELLDKVAEKLKARYYYMETEEGWGGYTVTDKDIDEVIENLKAEIGVTENV